MTQLLAKQQRAPARFDSPQQQAYLNLWRTYDRLRAIEDEFFAGLDLTAQQYNVLRLLRAQHPRMAATLDVADRLVSRAPDITRIIDKLEQRGLVTRVRSKSDRRTVLVGITRAGLTLLAVTAEALCACHKQQLGHMSAGDLKRVVALLRAMREPHEPQGSSWR